MYPLRNLAETSYGIMSLACKEGEHRKVLISKILFDYIPNGMQVVLRIYAFCLV